MGKVHVNRRAGWPVLKPKKRGRKAVTAHDPPKLRDDCTLSVSEQVTAEIERYKARKAGAGVTLHGSVIRREVRHADA